MPAPERYKKAVPEVTAIWESGGTFKAQTDVWGAQIEARSELFGKPPASRVPVIKKALELTPEEIEILNEPVGHETNKLLRLVQSRPELTPEDANEIHNGGTSSDVLDTSLSIQIRESLDVVAHDSDSLEKTLGATAIKHRKTLQIARSHGQHAVPHVFGRQVLGWYAEVKRGRERIKRAREVISVGKLSGEVGTHVFIPPEVEELALEKLGLRPDESPTQVISRDRHAEVVSLMAVNAGTLARIAMNIRLLSISDVGEVREPFDEKNQQGSSAMPHKRNPEKAERISGLNRRIRSAAAEELDAMILFLERDISHSSTERFTFSDSFSALSYAYRLTNEIMSDLVVDEQKMLENLNSSYGQIYSPRLLNELLNSGKGGTRTEYYELVKGLAHKAKDTKTSLLELVLDNDLIVEALGKEKINELFDPEFYLRNIDVAYKRAGLIK
ncbi:MAG TPA: adenylosuccinate lyase [Candidatus Levybacteria bacterium]|nr:adenylosuccinate lyase [Candidatus Levybacteria bacterium]